jgi:UDP-2-acetamido-2,6-beta-L-arabino-hexul-4-ose reductase
LSERSRILVTGASGFIGKNLVLRLRESDGFEVTTFTRNDPVELLPDLVRCVDVVVHLAGENRPADPHAFEVVNAGLTEVLCAAIASSGRSPRLILASSTQASQDNPYGRSKLAAEAAAAHLANRSGVPVAIYRWPGVFGKWCRPHYNSVVATFCHNIARDLPIIVSDRSATVRLVHVDDVVAALLQDVGTPWQGLRRGEVAPVHEMNLGDLADQIQAFKACRSSLLSERVGAGLVRALYATYISYLPVEQFSYSVPNHADPRGMFVEMLKTHDSGQFSCFTALPGVTRGSHYHHTKTEKFLVIQGRARFRFRHLLTGETTLLDTSGDVPRIVDTVPGWVHDITNVGENDLIVVLWANENFDRDRPDTIASKVQ